MARAISGDDLRPRRLFRARELACALSARPAKELPVISRCLCAFVLLVPSALSAQQTYVTGGDFRQQTIEDDTLNRAGRIEVGLNVAGALSFGSVTPDGGEAQSQTNIYVSPALVGGYMLTDNIELRLALGGQFIHQSAGDAAALTNLAFTGAVQGLYQRDLVLGLAIYGGLGLGGFYGWRHEEAGGTMGLEERFTSAGGLGQLLVGLLMMPGPRLVLRGGLRADVLFGGESPNSEVTMALDRSFLTVQILFDVAIGMRFG
jgi:hypothetical protein